MTELQDMLDELTTKFGDRIVANLGRDEDLQKIETISTGSLAVDMIIGAGGFPRGRASEVWGQDGGGKSTLMYSCIANLVKDGGSAIFIDMEHKVDDYYFRRCLENNGLTKEQILDHAIRISPQTGEIALDIAKKALDKVDLIVIDSIPALVTEAEKTSESAGDQFWAVTARLLSTNLRAIVPLAGLTRTAIVGINQTRDSMSTYGSPFRRSGGWHWKHSQSLRLWVRRVGSPIVDRNKKPIGITSRVTVQKNTIGPPEREVDIEIIWDLGVDPATDIVTVGPQVGVLEKNGGWHYYQWDRDENEPASDDGFRINGAEATKAYLRDNPELTRKIRAEILDTISESQRR